MKRELLGNEYTYIIDTDYGINKDGFIAIGTESIVYKGLKIKQDSKLEFSCVLKFKPKRILEDGKEVDRLRIFKEQEWTIFEKLRECRSIAKIDDVIEDLGEFSTTCNYGKKPIVISDETFFCVVEEFIDGWNLKQYCEEEFWKLCKVKRTEQGSAYYVKYQDYTEQEKRDVQNSYNYDNILKYQREILQFMQNLCEILQYVSEQELVLHMDLKPDNIMVTKYGKELVLIDFGRSRTTTLANRTTRNLLPPADYGRSEEGISSQFQHGTQGYAAPECYCEPAAGSEFPFSGEFRRGEMSIESDIFSFGATFWECLNSFQLTTNSPTFAENPRKFYLRYFMDDGVYFNRDLSFTSIYYHKMLENIIRKCTRRRAAGYQDPMNDNFYHSYKEIKKDLDDAINSVPTIVREENTRVKRSFKLGGVFLALSVVFLIVFLIFQGNAYKVAQEKWNSISSEYNDTQFYRLEQIARDLVDSAPANQVNNEYDKISKFTYEGENNDISEYDAALLVELLQKIDSSRRLPGRVDEIVQQANPKKLKEISIEIVKLGEVPDSLGYQLARAICDVEVEGTGKDQVQKRIAAYDLLISSMDRQDFHNAVLKLKNVLNVDAYINEIAEEKNCDPQEIRDILRSIT